MKLCDLLKETEYACADPVAQTPIAHITSDVHDIREDTLFVLVPGVRHDTTRLLPLVVAKRPQLIVLEHLPDPPIEGIPTLLVACARTALSLALFRFYDLAHDLPPLIGITGTNGKTTTATMLSHILTGEGMRVGRILTGGIYVGDEPLTEPFYSMTTPDPCLLYPALHTMRKRGCDAIVMEVSSHALALKKVAPLHFTLGLFTNLSEEHMDFHGSMEDYFLTKRALFSSCTLGIVNADDPYGRRLLEHPPCPMRSVGAVYDADVQARAIEDRGLDGCSYLYRTDALSFVTQLKAVGIHNVYNSALALCAAITLGIKPCRARAQLSTFSSAEGRMEQVAEHPRIYIDYAHTPLALKAALKTANISKNIGQKLILVFGCGGERDRGKRPRMAELAEKMADITYVTADNPRGEPSGQILEDILRGFTKKERYHVISDRRRAIETAILAASPDDIVLIVGKGHERYTVDRHGQHPFDERKIIKDVLNQR